MLCSAAAREHLLAEALAEAERLREMEDCPNGEGSPVEGSDRRPALPALALRQGAAETAGACARVTILGADTEVRDCMLLFELALNVLIDALSLSRLLHISHMETWSSV